MGFCFPGLDAQGGDLPPRKECAPQWRERVFEGLPNLKLMLPIGLYAQSWELKGKLKANMTDTVKAWRDYGPRTIPLPHPS
jgi:uracil-DNA glycosylase